MRITGARSTLLPPRAPNAQHLDSVCVLCVPTLPPLLFRGRCCWAAVRRDLDRDRRERRRDVRGDTTKYELVKEKDRRVTEEEKAARHRAQQARRARATPSTAGSLASPTGTLHSLRSPHATGTDAW